jgi:histidine ammonia-lyase
VGRQALERIAECRRSFLALLDADPELVVYGVTTRYGEQANVRFKWGGTSLTGTRSSRLAGGSRPRFPCWPSSRLALHESGHDPPTPLRAFLAEVRNIVPPVDGMRALGPDCERLAAAFAEQIYSPAKIPRGRSS